ncbi:hypothetical protein [Sphingomonas sp. IC4-52]|uniref:hypothetical protein n=1 Tax=Sphingomonas sp. IC4-52 TaxID=2887202 RepID=UPI001D0F7E87|nr:hypothetical protein [Sphingomonas sp. IC4-52]MCC2980466.1 hypothetical protein [Sphingomonas sp. IC4-52]
MKTIILSLALLLPAAAAPAVDSVAGFCTRMAAQHAMKPVSQPSGKPAYEARALKGLGVALFGGSTMVGMRLGPPDDAAAIGDPARFADACKLSAGRVACAVSGPAVFEMTVGDHAATTQAAAGEQAEVSMAKNRIRCEDR